MFSILKIAIAACVIAFASWLSGRKPELAGFITALPLVSILAIAFSYLQYQDPETTAQYARSIIFAVPISWLFFVPFFFIEKWSINFWISYGCGLILLVAGYFLHQFIMKTVAG
ncbi:DUF3147 family protein [Gilvimarinus sp. F26214L]|uniref:DUF3147 family protein n=1 Tax=Gilvimarinus sp. DZF01 TaxID=3461371 RepID=UPI0040460420